MYSSPATPKPVATVNSHGLIGHPVKVITYLDGIWWGELPLSILETTGRTMRFRRGVIVSLARKTALVQIGTRLESVELERLRLSKPQESEQVVDLLERAERLLERLKGGAA